MKKKNKKFEMEYSEFPNWYWIYGLHDAEILSFSKIELPMDWKTKAPRYNCIEIKLNSSGARTHISKIVFYNCSLKSDVDINTIKKAWWMGDKLTRLEENRFLLEVKIEDAKGNRSIFSIAFEDISVH